MQKLSTNSNSGVLIDVRPTDYIAGKETGITYAIRLESGCWSDYLGTREKQTGIYFDSLACVTFSVLNCIEIQVNWMIKTGQITGEKLQKIKDLGFIDENGNFNCSDRFTAYMSGTTDVGNYAYKVWDSVRKDGLLPEKDWPFPVNQRNPVFDWYTFYQDPLQERKDKAKLILEILDIKYEWIITGATEMNDSIRNSIAYHLKQAPLHILAPVCPTWNTGDVQACNLKKAGHATIIYNEDEKFFDYDHYEPFEKKLAKDYFIPYILKGVVSLKPDVIIIPPVEIFKHYFSHQIKMGDTCDEVKYLQKALKINGCFPTTVNETGYYGEITRQAVDKFYRKYKLANIIMLSIIRGKSVGPVMRNKLNQLYNI